MPSVRRDTVREHFTGALRRRTFEDLVVLDGVSFDVQPGETVGIMGRNGSGKSTLLKIVCGIYRADQGTMTVRGSLTPILELGAGWNPELDAIDNILLIGTMMGLTLGEARDAVGEILDFSGLDRFARLPLKHYSTGMAARLAYAVAFQAAREVLVLDEVFAVGDLGFRSRCEERYRRLADAGRTVLLVSHDRATILEFCRRALLLEAGRIRLDDTPERVVEEYARLNADA
jgi:ABC-type polysaccharide/polyol phosphate transport system ATPase subunit